MTQAVSDNNDSDYEQDQNYDYEAACRFAILMADI
jgi:hypothetical protein